MKICPICKKQYDSSVNICPQDSEILEEDLTALVGKTLDGQYLIEKLLGQGGMGAVFRARHILLGDQVAIKIMPNGISKSADYQRRFLREGKTARQFSHPNVVAVHDLRTTSDGIFYMVLEYVDGHTLSEELKKRRRFLPKEAVEILNPIGDALTMAHSLGIVHRDLKPDNIMIGKAKDGSVIVKLLDLGIAKVKNADATALTSTGQILGTPHYMSPEQWNGDEIDGRADIYSLGVILYELVAGVRPFSGKTVQKLAYEHSMTMPPLLCKVISNVSEEFSKVVEKCIEKEASNRPNGCQELFEQLRQALKYEHSNEELEQSPTLITSEPIDTSSFSQDKTLGKNQGTLLGNTEVTHAKAKALTENATYHNATLISKTETQTENKKVPITATNTLSEKSDQAIEDIEKTEETAKNQIKTLINDEITTAKKDNIKTLLNNENVLTKETKGLKSESLTIATNNSKVPLAIGIGVLLVFLTGGWFFLQNQQVSNVTSNPTPITSSTITNEVSSVALLEYWLEIFPSKPLDTKESSFSQADVKKVAKDSDFRFHFIAKQSGYLYILGLSTDNSLVTFLTNNPTAPTGLTTNKITAGEKLIFPNGLADNGRERTISFGGNSEREVYTVIFSSEPLAAPSFLNEKPGFSLGQGKVAEWEQFRATTEIAKVDFESDKERAHSIAKVTASKTKLEQPLMFNVTFEHE